MNYEKTEDPFPDFIKNSSFNKSDPVTMKN